MGDFTRSKEHYEKLVWLVEQSVQSPSWVDFGKVAAARSKVMNREKDVDLESLYILSQKKKMKYGEGWTSRYIGEILLNLDNKHVSDVEPWILKAIEADERNGAMFLLANDYALYGDLYKRKGDRSKAQENLGKALKIFKECGADGWVKKYQEQMEKLA